MQKGQIPQKQKELFEEIRSDIKDLESMGFKNTALILDVALANMQKAAHAFAVEFRAAEYKAEPRVVHKDKPGPESLVVSFSPTSDRVYFYIGYDLTKTCRIRLGDKLYLSEESDGEYRIGIVGDGKNAFTLTSAGGAVDYFKVTIPLRAIPFKKWIGRRTVDLLPGIGCVYFKV